MAVRTLRDARRSESWAGESPESRRRFVETVPAEINAQGFRAAWMPYPEHAYLRSYLSRQGVREARQLLHRLSGRLPLRAVEVAGLASFGLEPGDVLAAAVRLGLRVERATPGGVDGVVYPPNPAN